MLELVVAVVLGGAPVFVTATTGDGGLVRAKLADTGATLVDGSEVHRYLLGQFLGVQDFEKLQAKPIAGWPARRNAQWTAALRHCEAVVGLPPWRDNNTAIAAFSCLKRISNYLWQQYVTEHGAERVFELTSSRDEQPKTVVVKGATWRPAERKVIEVTERGPASEEQAMIERVIVALREERGEERLRDVIAELVLSAGNDPYAKEPVSEAPLTLKKTCAALPAHLRFAAQSPLARSLTKRWERPGASGSTVDCSLRYTEHQEDPEFLPPMTIITSFLTCGSTSVAAELAAGATLSGRPELEVVSERLAQALAAKLCR